ncbi:VOC family protein [Kribbella sp. NPDC056861]|uniref:VOC family protein n=1 Tax=Kribbella sp. NPDC056861 TaxID=3154857 RepID=UPI00341E2288
MTITIRAALTNVEVDDLDTAIPLYQQLAGGADVRRFTYKELEVAAVGTFLLLSGPTENYVSQHATLVVDSLDPVLEALEAAGAELLEAPNVVPNGTRIVARHPDGSVFEYMQPHAAENPDSRVS